MREVYDQREEQYALKKNGVVSRKGGCAGSVVDQFMEDTGYTDCTSSMLGIRKDFKRRNDWDFKSPTQMLKDFIKWQRKQND